MRSVPRYKRDKLGAAVNWIQSVRRVGVWCEMYASLGVYYETCASRQGCKQRTLLGSVTRKWLVKTSSEVAVCAVVRRRVHELARALWLLVVTICKWSWIQSPIHTPSIVTLIHVAMFHSQLWETCSFTSSWHGTADISSVRSYTQLLLESPLLGDVAVPPCYLGESG
jgi:hypothetical protein